jgi:hypothetical protein
MERGSSKHGPRLDEALDQEVRGMVTGIAGGRAQEWKDPEPAGEDQPEVTVEPDVPDGARGDAEQLSRLGRYIGRSALPGGRTALRHSAEVLEAPDDVLDALDRLPEGETYATVVEVWDALVRHL